MVESTTVTVTNHGPTNATSVNANLLGAFTPLVDLTQAPSVVSTGFDENGHLLGEFKRA